jgi:hypothetical protein
MGGPATLESAGGELDAVSFVFEGVAMSPQGLGARFTYDRHESEGDNLELMSTGVSLLVDYMNGGRLSFDFKDNDADIEGAALWPIAGAAKISLDSIQYGAGLTHVWNGRAAPSARLDFAWAHNENRYPGNDDESDVFSGELAVYPTKNFGFRVTGGMEEGDLAEARSHGGGVTVDMEQVGLFVDYTLRDVRDPGSDNQETLAVGFELRF